MSKRTMVVRVKVRVDVDLNAYEREYGYVVGSGYNNIHPSDIIDDLRTIANAAVTEHLRPLDNIYTVVGEGA